MNKNEGVPGSQAAKLPNLSFYNGRKVFITGDTGFKGSWLVRVLLDAGAQLTGYSLEPPTEPSLFKLLKLDKEIDSITGDIRNLEALKKAITAAEPDIVIHMAAQPLVRESYENPVYTYETNVIGTVNLLESCRSVDSIRSIVNVTTDKVYENLEQDKGYKEDDRLCGHDPYSNSKSCSELVTHSYKHAFHKHENAPALSTARSGNVIGGGDFAIDRLIPDCVRAAQAGSNVIVRNPGSTRPYQHVLDCLFGYLTLAEKQYDKKYEGSYNFGPDVSDFVDNGKLVDMFCDKWGSGIKRQDKPDGGPHEAHFLSLDCTKAKEVLGWKPKINIEKAIDMTIEWTKAWLDGRDIKEVMDKQIRDYFG